jgi:Gly-Xaa carboxypeptidase
MDEKQQHSFWASGLDVQVLPSTRPAPRSSSRRWRLALAALLCISIAAFNGRKYVFSKASCMRHSEYKPQCPVQEVIGPKSYPEITERNVDKLFKSDEFKKLAVERLSGAVQVPTENFDDMGEIGEDERWEVFYDLENYFKDTFPLV